MKKIMFNDRFGLTQAVLEGRKTMTRRALTDRKLHYWEHSCPNMVIDKVPESNKIKLGDDNTYFGIKDKITDNYFCDTITSPLRIGEVLAVAMSYEYVFYELHCGLPDECSTGAGWKNKMFVKAKHMPYKIRITNVGVERLQDISDDDCFREGIYASNSHEIGYGIPWVYEFAKSKMAYNTPRDAFSALIDKVSGRGTWESNPYVWVYEFELFN